jgi:hypothetical protein
MLNKDVNGKRINWGDRITRNFLFIFLALVYGSQFYLPYILPKPSPEIDTGMMESLKAIVSGIIWFMIGRNTQPAQEKPPQVE